LRADSLLAKRILAAIAFYFVPSVARQTILTFALKDSLSPLAGRGLG